MWDTSGTVQELKDQAVIASCKLECGDWVFESSAPVGSPLDVKANYKRMVSRVVVSEEFLLGFLAIHVLKEPGTERSERNRGVPAGIGQEFPERTGIKTETKTT